MAAAKGNQYAAKERVWTQAINNVLARRHPKGKMAALEDLAEKLVDLVATGDLPALKELGDRMEGKSPQGVELTGSGQNGAVLLEEVRRTVVDPRNPDA